MTKQIALSQQGKYKGQYFAIVDDEDFERVNQYRWFALSNGTHSKTYAARVIRTNGKRKYILMHNQIMNPSKGLEVDHVDGDGLNQRRVNLRICTHKQNAQNSKIHRNNKSGYKGAYYNGEVKKWQSAISIDGKFISLGYFPDPISAARAYDAAALKHFGAFARLNFPQEGHGSC